MSTVATRMRVFPGNPRPMKSDGQAPCSHGLLLTVLLWLEPWSRMQEPKSRGDGT